GIRWPFGLALAMTRFTPTHVGNTLQVSGVHPFLPVHPHARGEYGRMRSLPQAQPGSPPRTWGIRNHLRIHVGRHRFTPTHVGNTRMFLVELMGGKVHPHARG